MSDRERLLTTQGMVEGVPLATIRELSAERLGEKPLKRSIIGNISGCVILITTAGLVVVGLAAVAPNIPGWTRALLAESGKHGIVINNEGFGRSLTELATTLGRPNPISERLTPLIGEPFNPNR